MAQTIKHRRGKLEGIKDISPINGELIIASGSDLSVHSEGILFVGVEGDVLTPSNKILTGSSAIDVSTSDYDHSVDGIPFYDTVNKRMTILGHGGNTAVELDYGQIDFNGSDHISGSATQVRTFLNVEDNADVTDATNVVSSLVSATSVSSGNKTTIQSNLGVDAAGTDNSTDVTLAGSLDYITISGQALTLGSITNDDLAGSIGDSKLSTISAANKVSLSALDIDGATALGEAPAGADLIPVDDGAGGTNKSMTVTNLQSFMQSNLTFSTGDITGVTAGSGLVGGGASGTVVVGLDSGSIAGNALTAKTDGSGLDVRVDDATIEVSSDALRLKDSGITNAKVNASAEIIHTKLDFRGSGFVSTSAQVSALAGIADSTITLSPGAGIGTLGDFTLNQSSDETITIGVDGVLEDLDTLGAAASDGQFIVATGAGTFAYESGDTVRASLGVDEAGTDNSTDVTLGNTNYLSLTGQQITGGTIPVASGGTGATTADGARTNLGLGTSAVLNTAAIADGGTGVATADQIHTFVTGQSTTIGSTAINVGSTSTTLAGLTGLDFTAADASIAASIGANTLTVGGASSDVVIAGNLTVSGTRTIVDSTTVQYDDNILELNGGGANNGGIQVRDSEGGNTATGSFIWDTGEDTWKAGTAGSEKEVAILNADPTTNTVLKANSSNLLVDSAISDDGTAVTISSDLIISGLSASQLVSTNSSKQLVSSNDISALTLTLDGGEF